MFKTTDIEPASGVDLGPISLSVLVLDLGDEPPDGWAAFFSSRGVEIILDDVDRPSVSRDDARRLFAESRAAEARRQEAMRRAEQAAIEVDQRFRASIWRGLPADHMPPGAAPAAVMLASDRDAQPKRQSPLEEALSNRGDELIFHSYTEDESA
jgi:hypothetical protein